MLRDSKGQLHYGPIDTDGRFRLSDVSQGEAQVSVSSLLEPASSEGKATTAVASRVSGPAAVSSRIPVHYGDLGRSGLTVMVENESTLELDLK